MSVASKISLWPTDVAPTANSYPCMPTVSFWDGDENAGFGVHDPNSTTWTDLLGNYDLTRKGTTGAWGDNYHQFNGTYPFYNTTFPNSINIGPWTVECVFMLTQSMTDYVALYGNRIVQSGIYGLNYWQYAGGYNFTTGATTEENTPINMSNSYSEISLLTAVNKIHQYALSFRNGEYLTLSVNGNIVKQVAWNPYTDNDSMWTKYAGFMVGAGYCSNISNIGVSDS